MTARADGDVRVYHCIVCGPILRLLMEDEDGDITVHQPVPHPDGMTFDEEDHPQ